MFELGYVFIKVILFSSIRIDVFVIYVIIITFVINLHVTFIAVRATLVSYEAFVNELLVELDMQCECAICWFYVGEHVIF